MDQSICASLSYTIHFWYEVGMLKVPAVSKNEDLATASVKAKRPTQNKTKCYLADVPGILYVFYCRHNSVGLHGRVFVGCLGSWDTGVPPL